jgi:signal transduction histidine kinase
MMRNDRIFRIDLYLMKTKLKIFKMSTTAITPSIMMAPNYPSPGNLFQTLAPAKSTQEKPGQFASLAHEIRNPLSTINLSVEMLKSIITDDDQKMFLDMILRGSMRINDILTDVHSTFQANETRQEKYSVHELLNEVLAMAGDKIMLKHVTIRKNYAAKDSRIVMNRDKMKIALTNIVINAIDAMAGMKGELVLVTKSTDHTFVVQIEDNGCGIDRENLKNIFKPYFTNKPNGLGLGLATTQGILRSNHVRLNVKSVVGKGTSFNLVFEKSNHKPWQRMRNVQSVINKAV